MESSVGPITTSDVAFELPPPPPSRFPSTASSPPSSFGASSTPIFLDPDLPDRHQGAEYEIERGDPLLDDGPFVDPSNPLHEDMVGRDRLDVLAVVVGLGRGIEMVAARLPSEYAEDDLLHLLGEGALQVVAADVALAHENEPEPLERDPLLRERLLEHLFPHLSLAHEDAPEEIVEPPNRGVGVHHHSLLEDHRHRLAKEVTVVFE